MREIKFKGLMLCIDNKKRWVYGYLVDEEHIRRKEVSLLVDKETICEYTGLKDKNDVEIYENDVVKVNERYKGLGETDLLYKVDYVSRLAKYVYNPLIVNGKYDNNNNDVDLYVYETNDIEVIGNIYDKEVE